MYAMYYVSEVNPTLKGNHNFTSLDEAYENYADFIAAGFKVKVYTSKGKLILGREDK